MKTVTTLFCLSIFLITSLRLSAQEKRKSKELGITTSKFSITDLPFSLVYKWGQDDKFWKIEAANIGGEASLPSIRIDTITQDEPSYNFGLGFTLAKEKRHAIREKITVFHGIRFGLASSYYRQKDIYSTSNRNYILTTRYNVIPSVGYGLGIMFDLDDHFYLSAELNPMISYLMSYEEIRDYDPNVIQPDGTRIPFTSVRESIDHSIRLNANQSAVRLGIFYRFWLAPTSS